MFTALALALGLTALVGGAATAWLWLMQRPHIERSEGLKLLAAMRWREFSRLVVEGLRSRDFEPEAQEEAAERGQDSVLHLKRDGRKWLLACKQGANYRITPTVIGDMSDAVRFHGAAGGLVATPGSTEAQARRAASGQIELIDGDALWPLVNPQLADSVRQELATKARRTVTRQIALSWGVAAALGLLVVIAMPRDQDATELASTPAVASAQPSTAAAPAPAAAGSSASVPLEAVPLEAAPISEDEQRDDVIRQVSILPGVERVMWSTRSTLMVFLADEKADPVDGICLVMDKYAALRTSRLHLQPPQGATRPARFLQCKTY